MAGFADPNTALARQQCATSSARESSSRPSLPSGPCNYRNAASGACGCDHFWDKRNVELHDESKELPSSDRSTWCVCEHHACFHLRAPRAPEPHAFALASPILSIQTNRSHVGQSLPRATRDKHADSGQPYTSDPFPEGQAVGAPSQASTSGLPSLPSVCRLSYGQPQAADSGARYDVNQSRHTVAGLGLSLTQSGSLGILNRQQSPTPTVPDHASGAQPSFSEPEISSTQANSIANEALRVASPGRGILDPVVESNRNLQLDVGGDTIPNTYDPNEYIPSATEVATPSIANTPDAA